MDAQLVMFREDGSKRIFPLNPGVTTIGRKDDCTIRIPLAMVSRRHAEIAVNDGGATLKDLGASNGTFLNNQRVDRKSLEPGDQLAIGPVVFTVRIAGRPSDDELIEIRSQATGGRPAMPGAASVVTSDHVATADDEVDPIAALEALASSADQTAITPEEDE